MSNTTDRLAAFSGQLPDDMDAALITSAINRRYFLGFPSSAGTIVATKSASYFIIDGRYFEAARETVKNCEVILQGKLYEQIDGLLKKHGVRTLGIESENVTLSGFMKMRESLPGAEIFEDDRVSRLIWDMRAVKSEDEIASIGAAQAITEKTFDHILGFIKPGRTEIEISIEMEQFSRRAGSEEPAFTYIVAAGKNSSRPHAVPSENKVGQGDFVVLDFGATIDGYRSDMTRTVAVGHVSGKQREVYDTVLKAQLAALDAVRAGAVCKEVDAVARDIITAAGYGEHFGHGLGHALGIEVHEPPRLNQECGEKLRAGVVTSVEPGIYLPGEFGVRIEDIVAVTGNGCRNLTKADKSLIIL